MTGAYGKLPHAPMLGALHRHVMQVRAQRRLGNRRCIGRIVFLPLDERFDVDRRDQPSLVTQPLRETSPVNTALTSNL